MTKLPKHVGIIMDGNGRWAKARGFSRSKGHKQGAEVFGDIVRHARDRGIERLTVYAFSTENWNRPADEVKSLMDLLREYLRDADRYRKENARTRVIGDRTRLDEDLRRRIDRVEEGSRENTGIHVNIAINYGGRDELVNAARTLAEKLGRGEIQTVDETSFGAQLYTAGQPDVDLIIRTGGEQRLSNFLLWQAAYAELYFTDVLWPDFNGAHFDAALAEFAARDRRYGR